MENWQQCDLCMYWEAISGENLWGRCRALEKGAKRSETRACVIAESYFKLKLDPNLLKYKAIIVKTVRFFGCKIFQARKTD